MQELVGQTIEKLEVSSDQHLLRFTTTGGQPIVYQAEGDCCSESWFADIVGVKALLPPPRPARGDRAITKVEPLLLPFYNVHDGRGRQEEDQVYGYALSVQPWGVTVIAFRNSSNGYYGGWVELASPTEGKDTQWTEITDDWRA